MPTEISFSLKPEHDARDRAGHVLTFFKSFRSVLEQGPSAKSFRSCSTFHYLSVLVPFRSE